MTRISALIYTISQFFVASIVFLLTYIWKLFILFIVFLGNVFIFLVKFFTGGKTDIQNFIYYIINRIKGAFVWFTNHLKDIGKGIVYYGS